MISYCTNVHPAEDVAGIVAQLERYALPVRERLGADRLGVGLWLSAPVARGLADDVAARKALRAELDARGLAVYTLNAFPYGGFHDEVVKHAVYRPRWTDRERVAYTIDCVTVLADLLAEDASYGSISTLPLGWRDPWTAYDDRCASEAIDQVVRVIRIFAAAGDRPIRLAVEPEPGCVLDTVDDALGWLSGRVDPAYVGLCLDTCHLAVSFADPAETLAAIAASEVDVVKVQASAALHVPKPAEARDALATFAEPRYLHQVRELDAVGVVHRADDLPGAWEELPGEGPWRVHFHLPLHQAPAAPLATTTDVLRTVAAGLPGRPHLEVETYTWSVLLGAGDLVGGIAAELAWAQANLIGEGSAA
ncbi:metabolite traffic protein EboE [Amycolatopsis jiangsuensis]|uniref:Sugar phosphate isomerase/epimerase n=1 Tax=Amycolatopsis jiangsuensis TaxID=1181879 RepID=A0A840J6K0_9PSEU|nr:metabolite traffic protein EboE [Amycolatopsis jiangsuensis]MBB4689062.1 sugar phosphate isomerase/epimerase [Amycolatopsis jiangsuensis]